MPKVLGYTPGWLTRPSPGFDLFAESSSHARSSTKGQRDDSSSGRREQPGPLRLIAHRGSEVFAVVGNTIRWGDLSVIKYNWETHRPGSQGRNAPIDLDEEESPEGQHKVLRVAVHEQIQQIVISPNYALLAIATAHTVHVAVLPDSSQLTQPDTGPIKLKTHTIGPTVHVLSQPAIASLLWHPLSVNGECLVTVTTDAAIRLWELDLKNRWSFDTPGLAFDARKLSGAASVEEDLNADGVGYNKSFSMDAMGMEVAAAAFGGKGADDESGWSSMTLYMAMAEGDIYALCPLLPSTWQPPPNLIPSLNATTIAKEEHAKQVQGTQEERQAIDMQAKWLEALGKEEPKSMASKDELGPNTAIYRRPRVPSSIPQLQGPFQVFPDESQELIDLVDIYVVAPRVDLEELFDEEFIDVRHSKGVNMPIVNLLDSTGTVHICVGLEGLEPKWLPAKKSSLKTSPSLNTPPQLYVLSMLDTAPVPTDFDPSPGQTLGCPTFSPDFHSRYAFFVTHRRGIYFFSLDAWVDALTDEYHSSTMKGVELRLKAILEGATIVSHRIFRFEKPREFPAYNPVSAAVVLDDSDLGYLLLTSSPEKPYAALFDSPISPPRSPEVTSYQPDEPPAEVFLDTSLVPRIAYQPPSPFFDPLDHDMQAALNGSASDPRFSASARKAEIKMSSATLGSLTSAHRALSASTGALGGAVAELFTRGHRLHLEFSDQRRMVAKAAERIERLTGDDADENPTSESGRERDGSSDDDSVDETRGPARIEARLEMVERKQAELVKRHEELKKKLARASQRPLADPERAWAEEVAKMGQSVLPPEQEEGQEGESEAAGDDETVDGSPRKQGKDYLERLDEAMHLAQQLRDEAKSIEREESQERPASSRHDRSGSEASRLNVPADVRKKRVNKVQEMLAREKELVDATQARLERLSILPAAA